MVSRTAIFMAASPPRPVFGAPGVVLPVVLPVLLVLPVLVLPVLDVLDVLRVLFVLDVLFIPDVPLVPDVLLEFMPLVVPRLPPY